MSNNVVPELPTARCKKLADSRWDGRKLRPARRVDLPLSQESFENAILTKRGVPRVRPAKTSRREPAGSTHCYSRSLGQRGSTVCCRRPSERTSDMRPHQISVLNGDRRYLPPRRHDDS